MARPTKDEQIIKQNPGASPYELLQKGLSEQRYQELIAEEEKMQQAQPQEIKPQLSRKLEEHAMEQPKPIVQKAQPMVTKAVPSLKKSAPIMQAGKNMAWLVNKQTGRSTHMSAAIAIKQQQKYPDKYEVKQ